MNRSVTLPRLVAFAVFVVSLVSLTALWGIFWMMWVRGEISIVLEANRFSSFRGGASGLKERGVPTLSRKRDASRPETKPTRTFATTILHHILLPASAVRPQVARSTGRSSPALNGGFVDPEGRPVGWAHKTPRRANRGRKPHQSPTLNR